MKKKYPVLNKRKPYGVVYGGEHICFEQNGNCFLADGMHVNDPKGEHILEEVAEPMNRVEELEDVIAKLKEQLAAEKTEAPKEPPALAETNPMTFGSVEGMKPINLETCTFPDMKAFLKANNVTMKRTDNQNDLLKLCKEVNDGLEKG